MNRRLAAKAVALVALAFLALAVVLPIASADHAYSHRYIVFGRVVDANGDPVPGLTVNLGYEPPFEPEGPCAAQPNTETDAWGRTETRPVTNQLGEFTFCFHTHGMSRTLPGTGILRIDAAEVVQRFDFDPYTRHSFVPVVLETVRPEANQTALDETYTIHGTVWRPASGDTFLDGVKVFGLTVDHKPVNVTFTYNGKEPVTLSAMTNGYGDFAIRVPVTERPTSGTVTLEVENETFTGDVDPKTGVTTLRAEVSKEDSAFTRNFLIVLGAVVVLGGGGTAVWLASRRMRASREDARLRETSQRRRANK